MQGKSFESYRERHRKKMNKLLMSASLILFAHSEAFCPRERLVAGAKSNVHSMVPPDSPAGSFFHKVPDEGERDDATSQTFDDIDNEVTELLKQRRKPPRASKPSTIGGVPTAKATGESFLKK